MRTELKVGHCKEVLDQETMIGADSQRHKKFTFNTWMNEYTVWYKKGKGSKVDRLLKNYWKFTTTSNSGNELREMNGGVLWKSTCALTQAVWL